MVVVDGVDRIVEDDQRNANNLRLHQEDRKPQAADVPFA
jgi:hypothetical protein